MNRIFRLRFFASQSDNRKSKSGPADENPKWMGLVALAVAFALCGAVAEAQAPAKIPILGWLGVRPRSSTSSYVLLDRELRALGYIEGKNIIIEYRSADFKFERLAALAEELVRLKVDVLVTPSTEETLAAKKATKTIPIVFLSGGDPVELGLVDSFARPGETSQGPSALYRWLVNGWRYLRKPFPNSPALRCCGIHWTQALRMIGKKAN